MKVYEQRGPDGKRLDTFYVLGVGEQSPQLWTRLRVPDNDPILELPIGGDRLFTGQTILVRVL